MAEPDLNDRLIAGGKIRLAPVAADPDQYRDTPAGHCDRALERELLAAVVQGRVDALAAHLRPQAFSLSAHVTLAAFLVELSNESLALDVPTITTEIEKRGGARRGALIGALRDVALCPCAAAPKSAMDRIVDLAESRRVHQVLLRAVDAAARGDIVQAKELAMTVGESSASHVVIEHIAESVGQVARESLGVVPGSLAPTGLRMVDSRIIGRPLGSLTILAAGTGTGKTAAAISMCLISARAGWAAGYVSCEDERDVIGGRVLSHESGVPGMAIRAGRVHHVQQQQLENACDRIAGIHMHVAYEIGATDASVIQSMTALVRNHGARVLVVDYIQCITASDSRGDPTQDASNITRRIKAAAGRLNVPVILISQLSRPPKGDEFKRPGLHRLKESGDIENAAGLVLMLWRESVDDFAPVKGYIAKSKWGGGGAEWTMTRGASGLLVEDGCEP